MRESSKNNVGLYLILLGLLSFADALPASSITNFTKSVYFVPPSNFHMHDFSKDEYSDLFKYWGSGIGYEEIPGNVGDEGILFMLGPSCLQDGKFRDPMLPRSPADLRSDFDFFYHGPLNLNLTNLPPAKIGKTAGYISVSASTFFTNNDNYFFASWIQIKSNIVVKVEIQSLSKGSFEAATNSLKTLRINRTEILNILKSR
jgi:hypothetical protein